MVSTLGMGTLTIGAAEGISHFEDLGGLSQPLSDVMNTDIFRLPLGFYYAIIATAVLWYVTEYTKLGRHMVFVGQGREASRLSGIRVDRMRFGALVCGALVAGLAGEIALGTAGGFQASTASSVLLPAFAGAFLGSAVIQPGRFNAWGTAVAIYFLVTGITGLEILGFSGWVSDVFYGAAVVIAVSASVVVRERLLSAVKRRAVDTEVAPGPPTGLAPELAMADAKGEA
jgi:ribose transport system permease protein